MGYLDLLIHTVTVTNPKATGTTDRYGNLVADTESFTEAARVEPGEGSGRGPSEEILINRDTRITRFKIFLRSDTHVNGLSTLVWEGRSLRVDGEPRRFDGRNSPHHVEVDAEEILGG